MRIMRKKEKYYIYGSGFPGARQPGKPGAALINYFKPEYNVNFVENFPNENHKGYKQYFDLDYNALTVELDLEFDNAPSIQLYTATNRINGSFDFIQYRLFNDNERNDMYEIFKKDE